MCRQASSILADMDCLRRHCAGHATTLKPKPRLQRLADRSLQLGLARRRGPVPGPPRCRAGRARAPRRPGFGPARRAAKAGAP